MLERKNPAKAREYINAIVMNFDNYDSNFSYFKKECAAAYSFTSARRIR